MDRQRALRLVAGVLFALAGGAAAAFLVMQGVAIAMGLPAEATFTEPWLGVLGYAVWVGVAMVLSAAWLRRMRS